MAKLYAELTSDKGGRVASKGGDSDIQVLFHIGNKPHAIITLLPSGNVVLEPLSKDCDFIRA